MTSQLKGGKQVFSTNVAEITGHIHMQPKRSDLFFRPFTNNELKMDHRPLSQNGSQNISAEL